jgi:NTE family protein
MIESWHRARDIMHADKTDQTVRMSKIISRYLIMINKMHDILESSPLDDTSKKKLAELEPEFNRLACQRGAIIKEIVRVERKEDAHYLFEDADFSEATIKKLIKTGEQDATRSLEGFGK